MLTLMWLRGLLGRRSGRLAGAAVGVAIAVALLASLGSFLASSKATMTSRSVQQVAVDWQVAVQPGADPAAVLTTVRADPHVAQALPVQYGSTTGLAATVGGATLTTGAGRVVGIPPGYAGTFAGEFRYLTGAHDGVLIAQQTAANLHAAPGDRISIGRTGLPPATVTVAGIVDLPQANALFQKVGAPATAQPPAPPDNVVIMPTPLWDTIFGPLAATHPDQVQTQVQALTRRELPPDPAAAYTAVTGSAHHLEATLAGGGVIGDNLGTALGAARQDASYAQLLFLFLGAPGAVLAALLTAIITASGAERRRSEQALLRTRGARPGQLLRLALVEAAATGVIGAGVGLGGAALISRYALGGGTFSAVWAGIGAAVGLAVAGGTAAVPVWRDLRRGTTIAAARQPVGHTASPRWMRYGLDLWLLLGFALVWHATSGNGYQLVLAPDGAPTISVSYWAFAAPALLWAGAALLAWRVVDLFLHRGRPVLARLLRPLTGPLSGTAAAGMSRQRRPLARTIVLIVLAVAFAGSTAIFNSTYQQQALADAELSNGADVTVTEPPAASVPASTLTTLSGIPGVAKVAALQHRFAYIGADLQDLYGVNPSTLGSSVQLQNAYFTGGTAAGLMDTLAHKPDSILVSAETVKDYQLHPGDLIRLRLLDAHAHQQITVPFHYAGVVKEFPTAPKDSFFVANASYIGTATGNVAAGEFLITTDGTAPATVAARVRTVLEPSAHVTDITTTRNVVGSSLTAVDLAGLTRVELGFALLLAASATGLLLALGFTERRRTFALLRAVGARPRQLGALVLAEVGVVTAAGAVLGALAAWALTKVLVSVLTGVFDPPPDHLAVPWTYLIVVAAVGLACTGLAAAHTIRAARRPALEELRDL
ncbi:ABC transporter permease [Antrihabitans cavernicola]|uniref:FtsX-like permease family protein n=1 Tax=Antrihabitans cavernicola TaxID=2495913 RepID=A0A5A7S4T2_9NOCA|nr:ABC transporter permease [Spelaeibacter cavernicola]KAA0016354.1 FtsX-like permease family protein [Spelaeibacter cavernicola]